MNLFFIILLFQIFISKSKAEFEFIQELSPQSLSSAARFGMNIEYNKNNGVFMISADRQDIGSFNNKGAFFFYEKNYSSNEYFLNNTINHPEPNLSYNLVRFSAVCGEFAVINGIAGNRIMFYKINGLTGEYEPFQNITKTGPKNAACYGDRFAISNTQSRLFIYVLNDEATAFVEEAEIIGSNDNIGDAMTFLDDSTIFVAKPFADPPALANSGTIQIFTRTNSTWTSPTGAFQPPGIVANANFGIRADAHNDVFAASVRSSGDVFIYHKTGPTWPTVHTRQLVNVGGDSCISINDNYIVIGQDTVDGNTGRVSIYANDGVFSNLVQEIIFDDIFPARAARFGYECYLNEKNELMLSGFNDNAATGVVLLFADITSAPTTLSPSTSPSQAPTTTSTQRFCGCPPDE
jgi:hypothetical protein